MSQDHLHIYNLRGYCWCGAHRDDWLTEDKMLDVIGQAFKHLNKKARGVEAHEADRKSRHRE